MTTAYEVRVGSYANVVASPPGYVASPWAISYEERADIGPIGWRWAHQTKELHLNGRREDGFSSSQAIRQAMEERWFPPEDAPRYIWVRWPLGPSWLSRARTEGLVLADMGAQKFEAVKRISGVGTRVHLTVHDAMTARGTVEDISVRPSNPHIQDAILHTPSGDDVWVVDAGAHVLIERARVRDLMAGRQLAPFRAWEDGEDLMGYVRTAEPKP